MGIELNVGWGIGKGDVEYLGDYCEKVCELIRIKVKLYLHSESKMPPNDYRHADRIFLIRYANPLGRWL
jgi:hypothetical protein